MSNKEFLIDELLSKLKDSNRMCCGTLVDPSEALTYLEEIQKKLHDNKTRNTPSYGSEAHVGVLANALHDRDGEITELNNSLTKKDAEVDALVNTVDKQRAEIDSLYTTLEAVHNTLNKDPRYTRTCLLSSVKSVLGEDLV